MSAPGKKPGRLKTLPTGNKPGRPRKVEVRDKRRGLRFSARELAIAAANARQAGLTFGEFGRAMMLAGNRQPLPPLQAAPIRLPVDPRKHEEIRRLGVNLNQIARHMNTHPQEAVPADLPPLLTEIRAYLRSALADEPVHDP